MTNRVPCSACGELIHTDTAAKNSGLCMPCKGGYRDRIEAGKRQREDERKYDKSPARLFWLDLVRRVHSQTGGVSILSPSERTYYAVRCLLGEVFNGGFYQFFANHSGELYGLALDGLLELEASRTYALVLEAKELLFGDHPVPVNFEARNTLLPEIEALDIKDKRGLALDALEKEFWSNSESLDSRCTQFAVSRGLYDVQ